MSSLKSFPRIAGTIALLLATDFGDHLESLPSVRKCPQFLAVLDNMIHLWIGTITWSIIADDPWALNLDLLLVATGSSVIDFDHFLAAGSLSPGAAMQAPHRGILHCTSLLLLAAALLHCTGRPHLALLLLVSFVPHHLRDSQRRGLYLVPFLPHLQTPPLPTGLVRLLLPLVPWVLRAFLTPKIPQSLPYKVLNV